MPSADVDVATMLLIFSDDAATLIAYAADFLPSF